VLAALVFVTYKLFSARDASGNSTAPNVLMGCGAALVLCGIGCVALLTFIAGAITISASESVKSVPDFKVRAWRDPQTSVHRDASHPLHLVLQWKGHSEPTESLLQQIEQIEPGSEIEVHVDYETAEAGAPDTPEEQVTTVDLAFPARDRDLDQFERKLRRLLPKVSLSEGIEIEFKSLGEVR
jgi:hypothetical protein